MLLKSNAPLWHRQAFDDCTTPAAVFKLLEGFEGLLDRGAIAADLERKALLLMRSLASDLREVSCAAAHSACCRQVQSGP